MFIIWLGLTMANIVAVWLFSTTGAQALDRSFFQGVAIVIVCLCGYRTIEL